MSSVDRDILDKVENATALEDSPSYPPVSQTIAKLASRNASATGAESPGDPSLLPATTGLRIIPKRPTVNDEDELVVIDDEHREASDGENWSEVEA